MTGEAEAFDDDTDVAARPAAAKAGRRAEAES